MTVAPGDVLVLTWDGPEPEAAAVFVALGAQGDAAKVDIFDAAKVAPVGLDVFLAEGHAIDSADLEAWKWRLDAIEKTVVVLPARAFPGARADITVAPPLAHVATFREADPEGAPVALSSEGAKGTLGGGRGGGRSDARMGGMVALAVLLFLAAFVAVFVLMAG